MHTGRLRADVRGHSEAVVQQVAYTVACGSGDVPDEANPWLVGASSQKRCGRCQNLLCGVRCLDCEEQADQLSWFAKLRAANVHESIRKECMNFEQGYRHAIQAIREPPFESDSQRESCEACSGIFEQLLEQFGPLRLLQLDIYEHLGIQDPIRNLAIIYKVAGDDYHRFLALAFPPYDFSLQYEEDREYQEQQLANFREMPSAFDFGSSYAGSGATGSTDGSVLDAPKVAS